MVCVVCGVAYAVCEARPEILCGVLFVVLRNMTEMIHFILGSSIYR